MDTGGVVLPSGLRQCYSWRLVRAVGVGTIGPPPASGMEESPMVGEFRNFLLKTIALALAIGVVALVVWQLSKLFIKEEAAASTKTCPFCKEANALDATKCRACASAI
jgi:ribosomal protein L40E